MVLWEKQGLNLNLWKNDSNHDQMSEHLCPVDNEEAILLGEDIPANLFKEDQPEETIIVDEADDCVSSRSHPSESEKNVQETVKPSILDLSLVTKQVQDPQEHQQTHAAEDECSSNSDEITESNMVNEVIDDLTLTSDDEPMVEDLYSQVSFKIKKTRDVSINNAPDLSNQISDISKDQSVKKPKENCFTAEGDIQKSETEKKSADSPVVSDQVKINSNHNVASDHDGTSQVQENVSMEDKVPQLNTEKRKRFKRILHLP
uniref:Uncharacterized protein n=1 Tax=Ciona savignyi TaxID=51511 RepID=H2Y890_CIOSA